MSLRMLALAAVGSTVVGSAAAAPTLATHVVESLPQSDFGQLLSRPDMPFQPSWAGQSGGEPSSSVAPSEGGSLLNSGWGAESPAPRGEGAQDRPGQEAGPRGEGPRGGHHAQPKGEGCQGKGGKGKRGKGPPPHARGKKGGGHGHHAHGRKGPKGHGGKGHGAKGHGVKGHGGKGRRGGKR